MAWPSSRIQTFVANVTVITAAFLNQLQDGITDAISGLVTLKAVVVDGFGGSAVIAPVPGTVTISAMFGETAEPTAFRARGVLSADLVPIAGASISGPLLAAGSPGLVSGVNIKSVTRTGVGKYVVTFLGAPPATNPLRAVVVATVDTGLVPDGISCQRGLEAGTNNLQVTVNTIVDMYFSIVVWFI